MRRRTEEEEAGGGHGREEVGGGRRRGEAFPIPIYVSTKDRLLGRKKLGRYLHSSVTDMEKFPHPHLR